MFTLDWFLKDLYFLRAVLIVIALCIFGFVWWNWKEFHDRHRRKLRVKAAYENFTRLMEDIPSDPHHCRLRMERVNFDEVNLVLNSLHRDMVDSIIRRRVDTYRFLLKRQMQQAENRLNELRYAPRDTAIADWKRAVLKVAQEYLDADFAIDVFNSLETKTENKKTQLLQNKDPTTRK